MTDADAALPADTVPDAKRRDPPPIISEDEAVALLNREIRRWGGVNAFARRFGISAGYVSQARRGLEDIGPGLQGAIGVRETRMFFVISPEKEA